METDEGLPFAVNHPEAVRPLSANSAQANQTAAFVESFYRKGEDRIVARSL